MNERNWITAINNRPIISINPKQCFAKTKFNDNFFPNCDSKQQKDLILLKEINLILDNFNIAVSFLHDNLSYDIISLILYAINSYCFVHNFDYSGLNIYVLLDDNKRDIVPEFGHDFAKYCQSSKAFNVCGFTNRDNKTIYVTRKEDIIRLLFHEMNHYTHNDMVDYSHRTKSIFDTEVNDVITAEIYAEYISILESAYFISIIYKINTDWLIEQEKEYNCSLIAKHLKYYGYTSYNYRDFFYKKSKKNIQHTYIWEYVFYRGILLIGNDLIDKIEKYMNLELDYNVSMSYNSRIYKKN